MRVLKHGNVDRGERVRKVKCDYCGCVFEYDDSDLVCTDIYAGFGAVECPDCGEPVQTPDWVSANSRTIRFPEMFHNHADAKHVEDDDVQEMVRKCLKRCEEGEDMAYSTTGDVFVMVKAFEGDDECYIVVARGEGFWECTTRMS